MTKKFDKIKNSKHHEDNLLQNRPGHNVPLSDAETLIENPLGYAVQSDGRERYWGDVEHKLHRAVVSATVSAGNSIGRLVTVYRDKKSKIGKPD